MNISKKKKKKKKKKKRSQLINKSMDVFPASNFESFWIELTRLGSRLGSEVRSRPLSIWSRLLVLCLWAGGRAGGRAGDTEEQHIYVVDVRWWDGKRCCEAEEGKRHIQPERERERERQTGGKKVGKMLMALLYCWRFNSMEWRRRRRRPAEYKTATLHVNLIGFFFFTLFARLALSLYIYILSK